MASKAPQHGVSSEATEGWFYEYVGYCFADSMDTAFISFPVTQEEDLVATSVRGIHAFNIPAIFSG